MKTQKVKFKDIQVRTYFYDFGRSAEWMIKLDSNTAMWGDGLQTEIACDEIIEIIQGN